jgi:hypothetical protein
MPVVQAISSRVKATTMDFSAIVRRTWDLWFRNRGIWILGMLAALTGQSEYTINSNFSQQFNSPSGSGDVPEIPQWFTDFAANPWPLIISATAASLVFSVLVFLVGTWIAGALIHQTSQVERGQPVTIGESFGVARDRYVTFLGLRLLLQIPVILAVIITMVLLVPLFTTLLPLIADPSGPVPTNFETLLPLMFGSFLCLIPLFLILAVYGLFLTLIDDLAYRYCILEGSAAWQSLRQAWQMLTKNIGQSLITWLLLGGAGFLFSLVAAIPAFAIFFSISGGILERGFDTTVIGGFALLFVYSLVMTTVAGGILTSFNATMWTVLFRLFQQPPPAPVTIVASSSEPPA